MINFSAPFPNPDVFYAYCGKCGRKLSAEADQRRGVCGHCVKQEVNAGLVQFKIGDGKIILSPVNGIPIVRIGDIILYQRSGARFLLCSRHTNAVAGRYRQEHVGGMTYAEKPVSEYRRFGDECGMNIKEEMIAIVGRKKSKETPKQALERFAAIPGIFDIEIGEKGQIIIHG